MALNPIIPSLAGKTPLADRYQKAAAPPPGPTPAGAKELGTQAVTPPLGDQAEISSQAHRLAALRETLDVARVAYDRAADVRADRVAQARERVASGFYQSAVVRDQVAARMENLLFEREIG